MTANKIIISVVEEKYNKGEFILAPGTLISKQVQAENEDSAEITEWIEF